AIEELICALQDFDGTVLTVSHNTYFLSQIATRVVELNRDGVQDYKMGFDEYRTLRALDHSEDVTAQLTRLEAAPQEDAETGGKQSYEERKRQRNQQKQLQRELERLEKKSESIEAEIEALDLEMASPGFFRDLPVSKQSAVQSKKAKLEEDLQRTLAEWERIGQQVWAAD
ncbi:MAG: hypothetical protein KDK78_10325, partial [Chlamydiia bacterium]|nr:hypothetical protein [Chlamydiia bacterium]